MSATYVAMGDSYTTGGGIGDSSGYCLRSSQDYPTLVAKQLKIDDFQDSSCGGATTADLTASQRGTPGSNPPQTQWLGEKTTLVTLGIGLNDAGLASRFGYACVRTGPAAAATCDSFLQMTQQEVNAAIQSNALTVQDAIKQIRSLAPKAQIVLVGYPRLLSNEKTCPGRLPLDPRAVDRFRGLLKQVNVAWKRAADVTGALYVDTYAASKGHDVCSQDPWINGLAPEADDGASLHPNAEYHSSVADLIIRALGKNRTG